MALGHEKLSLTKQPPLEKFRIAAASFTAGMSVDEVRAALDAHGARDLAAATKLFRFEGTPPALVLDELVRTCQGDDPVVALQLLWVARLWNDGRLASVVEQITDARGKFDPAMVNKGAIRTLLKPLLGEDAAGLDKSSSNLLGYLVQAKIIVPVTHGSSIVGMADPLPTAAVVPHLLRFMQQRAGDLELHPPPGSDAVDLALGLGLNHWVNLTADEFRRAANPPPAAPSPTPRPALTDELLVVVDAELRRRGQVVLQGPPGVGKTYEALRYVDWATAERRPDSHLQQLLDQLPSHERTPAAVAALAVRLGLRAVWDIVQFHPSYGYEDFVRTLAARPGPTGVVFVAEHRTLSFLAAVGGHLLALGADVDVVLVVDEVNRADISRVFGELLYALEYRGQPVATPHEVDGSSSLAIPTNLLLLGTMNTADRSIALIDYALRRRFTFITIPPSRAAVADANWVADANRESALRLYDLVAALFSGTDPALASLAVGHSYFLPPATAMTADDASTALATRFSYETFPLLLEYAAEGLLDAERVSGLAAALGFDPAQGQARAQEHVLAWLLPGTGQ